MRLVVLQFIKVEFSALGGIRLLFDAYGNYGNVLTSVVFNYQTLSVLHIQINSAHHFSRFRFNINRLSHFTPHLQPTGIFPASPFENSYKRKPVH